MAKMHKEKRSSAALHNARHSTLTQPQTKPVRLTPAEIRAQNNGELSRSQSDVDVQEVSRRTSEGHVTPPPSPTKEQSAYQTQLARTASQSQRPPTPPRSPRISLSKTVPTRQNAPPIAQPLVSQYRQSMPIEAYQGIVGTPTASTSRTSSISSIKAPMKYRGHEITRTGSLSMFQAPQPDIVMNPLSNFSRPRNKYSPPGSYNRQDGSTETYETQHRRNDTSDSGVSSLLTRSESPEIRSGSPVSFRTVGSRASRQFVIVTEDSLPKMHKKISFPMEANTDALPNTVDTNQSNTKSPVDAFPAIRPVEKSKRMRDMNKTSSVSLDKAINPATEIETKKKRRHTFSWKRMSGLDLKTDFKNELPAPKEDPVAERAKQPRPHSAEQSVEEQVAGPTREEKGKGKEVAHDHAPSIIGVKCCDKCGRIRKLQDGRPLAGSGKAQETLVVAGPSAYKMITARTVMPGPSAVNPAGAANAAQLIMHRQRRPKPEPPAMLPNDHAVKDFAASPTATAQQEAVPMRQQPPEKYPEPPVRITRFASLHGISHEKEIAPPMPTLNTTLNSGKSTVEAPHMKATSTPIDEPLPELMYDPAEDDEHFVEAPTQQRRYSFESQRSIINVTSPKMQERSFETQKSAPEVVRNPIEPTRPIGPVRPPPRPIGPIDLSKPILLPEPNLGLHFARSNLTLRGLVMPKGGSSANLLADLGLAGGETDGIERGLEMSDHMDEMRMERERRVGDIMAV